jgi:hypothetical protein
MGLISEDKYIQADQAQYHEMVIKREQAYAWQMMPDLYILQILLQSYCNVIVLERICDGGKFFCSMYKLFGKNLEYDRAQIHRPSDTIIFVPEKNSEFCD